MSQGVLFASDGRIDRATPAATRRAARDAIAPVTGEQRQKVLAALRASPGGLTTEELEAATGLSGSSCRPRLIELRELGAVVESGATRKTKSGRDAVVWVAA